MSLASPTTVVSCPQAAGVEPLRPKAVARVAPQSTPALDPLCQWLLTVPYESIDSLLSELNQRLSDHGVDTWRSTLTIDTPHPQVSGRRLLWARDQSVRTMSLNRTSREGEANPSGIASTVSSSLAPTRRRLVGPAADLSFPICRKLAAEGGTDYWLAPLPPNAGRSFVSFVSDAPGGFTEEALAQLERLLPFLATRVETEIHRFTATELLQRFLGRTLGEHVSEGAYRTGEGQTFQAAILQCTLTRLPETGGDASNLSMDSLDFFYSRVANVVEEQGGEVLEFSESKVLAVFDFRRHDAKSACVNALTAVRRALKALFVGEHIETATALNVGEVVCRNVGGSDRFGFAVSGRGIAEAERMSALCVPMGLPLLMSEAFVEAVHQDEQVCVGHHKLMDSVDPKILYTLTEIETEHPVLGHPLVGDTGGRT